MHDRASHVHAQTVLRDMDEADSATTLWQLLILRSIALCGSSVHAEFCAKLLTSAGPPQVPTF